MMKRCVYIVMGMWCLSGGMHQSLQAADDGAVANPYMGGAGSIEISNPDRARIESFGRSAKLYGPAVALALLTLAAGVSTKLAQSAEKKNLSKAAERLTGWLKLRRWLTKHGYKVTGGLGAATAAALAVGGGLDWRERKMLRLSYDAHSAGGADADGLNSWAYTPDELRERGAFSGSFPAENMKFVKDKNDKLHLVYTRGDGKKCLLDFTKDVDPQYPRFFWHIRYLNGMVREHTINNGYEINQNYVVQYVGPLCLAAEKGFFINSLDQLGQHLLPAKEGSMVPGALDLDGLQVMPVSVSDEDVVYLPVVRKQEINV